MIEHILDLKCRHIGVNPKINLFILISGRGDEIRQLNCFECIALSIEILCQLSEISRPLPPQEVEKVAEYVIRKFGCII